MTSKKNKVIQRLAQTSLFDLLTKETISSREIAEYAKKRHDNVMRDIERIRTELKEKKLEGGDLKFEGTSYKDVQNKERPEILMNKDASLLVITAYDLSVRLAVQRRWRFLEQELAAKKETAQKWVANRQLLADEYKKQSTAIYEVRKEQGKETPFYVYAREAKVLWWAFAGGFAKILRSHLSPAEIASLCELEDMNAALIRMGQSYEERKAFLREYALKHDKLIEAPLQNLLALPDPEGD